MAPQSAAENLVQSNEHLKQILDVLNISYTLYDMNFVLLDVNQSFLNLTGAKKEKILGLDMRTIISPEDTRMVTEKLLPAGVPVDHAEFEFYVYSNRNREKIQTLFNASLNRDKNGNPVSVNVLMMDLREQKTIQENLEKEKKMLQAILFGIHDSVTIFDAGGAYLFSNPKGLMLRSKEKSPLLPLGGEKIEHIELDIGGRRHYFTGESRAIYDNVGHLFAYAETLTDITDKVRLEEKEKELFHFRRSLRRDKLKSTMIGTSRSMQGVFEAVLRCAEVDSSVLVTGETGVGKEVAARAIHNESHRKGKPFVAVNCGALPENLLESELFGHVKGAFTGAISNRPGLFREASGGTLFLDEIGDLPKPLQVKLLRVLQEREVRPVGGDAAYPVDVRIISATNKCLVDQVKQGHFRHDLFYRVAVIPVNIPPLRNRREDIIGLSDHFIQKHQRQHRNRIKRLDSRCHKLLSAYPWPGNIRELENAIEHAIAMATGETITPQCLPGHILSGEEGPATGGPISYGGHPDKRASAGSYRLIREKEEKQAIRDALERSGGNQTRAAADLGMSRVTLWRKKKKYRLT